MFCVCVGCCRPSPSRAPSRRHNNTHAVEHDLERPPLQRHLLQRRLRLRLHQPRRQVDGDHLALDLGQHALVRVGAAAAVHALHGAGLFELLPQVRDAHD